MSARVELWTLAPGARFALPEDDGVTARRTGTLIYATEYRARVRWDASARHVTIQDDDGAPLAEFDTPGRAIDIAARTMVVQL